jgi:hypothetical protein
LKASKRLMYSQDICGFRCAMAAFLILVLSPRGHALKHRRLVVEKLGARSLFQRRPYLKGGILSSLRILRTMPLASLRLISQQNNRQFGSC